MAPLGTEELNNWPNLEWSWELILIIFLYSLFDIIGFKTHVGS